MTGRGGSGTPPTVFDRWLAANPAFRRRYGWHGGRPSRRDVLVGGGAALLALAAATGARAAAIPSVVDFGADPTGGADATAAFAAALAASKQVWVPPGTFRFTDTTRPAIVLPDGGNLQGAGLASTLQFQNGAQDCIRIGGNNVSGAVSGLKLDCTTNGGGWAFNVAGSYFATIRNVLVDNAFNGALFNVTNGTWIENVIFQGIRGRYGIWYTAPLEGGARSDNISFVNVVVQGLYQNPETAGFYWSGPASTVNGFQIALLGCAYGFYIPGGRPKWPEFANLYGCVTDGMSVRGATILAGASFKFTDCWLTNTSGADHQGGNDQQAVLIATDAGYSHTHDISFTGCRIGLAKGPALVSSGRDVALQGCSFVAGSTTPRNAVDALVIANGARDHQVTGCRASEHGSTNAWRYGLVLERGSVRSVVTGNNFGAGALSGAILNESDDPKTLVANNI